MTWMFASLGFRTKFQSRQGLALDAIADVAHQVASGVDLGVLLDRSASLIARTLEVEFAEISEVRPQGLLLRAGVGWTGGLIGQYMDELRPDSLGGHLFQAHTGVVIPALAKERRFRVPPLLLSHGIVSGISVPIVERGQFRGSLGAYSTRSIDFTWDDIVFLETTAAILGASLARDSHLLKGTGLGQESLRSAS